MSTFLLYALEGCRAGQTMCSKRHAQKWAAVPIKKFKFQYFMQQLQLKKVHLL